MVEMIAETPRPAGQTINEFVEEVYKGVAKVDAWDWCNKYDEEGHENEAYKERKALRQALRYIEASYPTYGPIFDTGYLWGVPYLIDVEKLKGVAKPCFDIGEAYLGSLVFTGRFSTNSDCYPRFQVRASASHRNRDDKATSQFDCKDFDDRDRDKTGYNAFKDFMVQLTGCITGVDTKAVDRFIVARMVERESLSIEIEHLKRIKGQGISRGEEINDHEAILKENDKP